ncbi:MAG: LodA/GoxA family CTQ-dependent oxidase [Ktedonobacteraceae bacterium]
MQGTSGAASVPIFKIHPAIGIARVGDADADHYFIGPETPGVPANWDFGSGQFLPFKQGVAIKRQAARFRIWEYVQQNGQIIPAREITLDDVQSITWTVHLANRKASFYQFNGQVGAPDNFKSNPLLRNASMTSNRAQLDIDEGSKAITAAKGVPSQPVEFKNSKAAIPIETLGQLRTDEHGRLLVIGGKGKAASPNNAPLVHFANNDHWFDDTSDGPVTATITLKPTQPGGQPQHVVAEGAWVVVAPPDFAPAIGNIVTLYDTLYDMAVRELTIPLVSGKPVNGIYGPYQYQSASGTLLQSKGLKRLLELNTAWQQNGGKAPAHLNPSFTDEIFPILFHAYSTRWVFQPLQHHHELFNAAHWMQLADNSTSGPAASLRATIFGRLRNPDAPNQLNQPVDFAMPRIFGDDYDHPDHPQHFLSLTRTQYATMDHWQRGDFQNDWNPPHPPTVPPQEQITPEGLDRAALENCAGGGFHPGIEVSWLIRKKEIFSEPFRIKQGASLPPGPLKVNAGFFSQQMGVPWQADSHSCLRELYQGHSFAWWPGQRPDDVYLSAADVAAGKMVSWTRSLDGSFADMVNKWSTLHFVVKNGDVYIEQ